MRARVLSPSTFRLTGNLKSWLFCRALPRLRGLSSLGGDVNVNLEQPRSEREAESAAVVRRSLARWV
eukprot:10318272-Lingulodinium_polyedra.AAC.1